MKKRVVLLCIVLGMGMCACNPGPPADEAVQTSADTETSRTEQKAETAETAADPADGQTEQKAELKQYEDAVPVVYMTEEISPSSMLRLYQSADREVEGSRTAVAVAMKELTDKKCMEPALLRDLVQYVNGTLVECSADIPQDTKTDSGFADIAKVLQMDEDGSLALPVNEGVHLKENYVGAHFSEFDGFLVISHFHRNEVTGFGGAVKNISIDMSSGEGKCLIYSAGNSRDKIQIAELDAILESMAEAGKSVADALNENLLYMNVMNRFSAECSCDGDPGQPDVHDIGILASADPVALDQACVDLVYMTDGYELFIDQIELRNGEYALEYAEEIGLGSSAYTLLSVDNW